MCWVIFNSQMKTLFEVNPLGRVRYELEVSCATKVDFSCKYLLFIGQISEKQGDILLKCISVISEIIACLVLFG